MNLDRKQFVQMSLTGGLGLLFGGSPLTSDWIEKGTRLKAFHRKVLAMGSVIAFEVVAETEGDAFEAIRKGEQELRKMEAIFSMYDENSEISRLSETAGKQSITLSPEAIQLLQYAKKMAIDSEGLFDITIEPVMRKWGFRKDPESSISIPSDAELQSLEKLIGFEHIHIEENKVVLGRSGMALDMGGIAGGFALDSAIRKMKKCNIKSAFINFSGDIHCFGQPLEGLKWPVRIWNPKSGEPLPEVVMLEDEALSTSGANQNRRYGVNNQSWGHLITPRAVRPTEPVTSITVISPSATMADAWSTAGFLGARLPDELSEPILIP